jgi:dipeptidyl aminopeptidase/acylaminoacyl peptidase
MPTQTLEVLPTASSINELPITELVSVASDGTQGNSGSHAAAISADGRYVTFSSSASNLVEGDTNGIIDILVHDRKTGQTKLVSIASDGTQGNNDSGGSSISADGRYVAFFSSATNLVEGDTNGVQDCFVHDRVTGETTRVSVASDGTQANGASGSPYCYCPRHGISISSDGRYVWFMSEADNLVEGDTNGLEDTFVHDRVTGETTVLEPIDYVPNGETDISADGRCETFADPNVGGSYPNGISDVFVRCLGTSKQPIASITELYGVWTGLWSTDQLVFMEFIATMQPQVDFEDFCCILGDETGGREWFTVEGGILTFGAWVKGAWVKPFSASTDCVNNPQATYEVSITYPVDHPKKLRFVLVGEDHCIDRQTFLDGQNLTWNGTSPP